MNNKNITHSTKTILLFSNLGLFALAWLMFYNHLTFSTHKIEGSIAIIIAYYLLYSWLCNVYKAFRIASSSLGESIFAQLMSFGVADVVMYLVCCISRHNFADLFPIFVTACMQVIVSIVVCIISKKILMKSIKAEDTLLIAGSILESSDGEGFVKRLQEKYGYLFSIKEIIDEKEELKAIKLIEECHSIILYDCSETYRKKYISKSIELEKTLFFTPRIEDILIEGSSTRHLLDTPLLKYDYTFKKGLKLVLKRLFDILLALILLVLFSPVMLITAIAIKLEDHGPVLFKQKRYTKDSRIFEIYKFRSMRVDADKMGVVPTTKGDPRITKVGKFIRAVRIDEFPQLINILKGDMSFVGPRPERVEHVDLYSEELPEFKYRLKVRGGLTGYAQVYGKYNTSPYDKLRLDLLYIENQTLLLDFKLLLLTIKTVITPESTEGFDQEKSNAIQQETSKMKKESYGNE